MWLSRDLAIRNHYPALDVLGSISRLMIDVTTSEHLEAAARVKALLAAHKAAEDLISVGMYVKGTNPEVDQAVQAHPAIQKFLRQGIGERPALEESRKALLDLVKGFGGGGK
jgi:flagellar biosynthesis/type III secretory pathway ATPase